jgi:undecaprenyl-diphosphatase
VIQVLSQIDQKLFLILNSWNLSWLNRPMVFISQEYIWIPLIALIFFRAFRKMVRRQLIFFTVFLACALIASDVTSSYIFKNIFLRLRPCRLDELKPLITAFGQKCGGKFGFVSSHAANSFCLAWFCLKSLTSPRWFKIMIISLAVVVSYSRIYLGAHYPGDILGGALVGTIWGLFFAYFFRHIDLRS